MADTPIHEKKFTDQEVREILKRAVEKAPSRSVARTEGTSLAELQAIGGEVGIDPARLEDAARAVALGAADRPGKILGGPTVLNFERKVEGEFDPRDTPEILSVIRRTMGHQGEVDDIHGSLEWRAKGDSGERSVTVSSRDGTTTISSWANLSNAAVLTYLPAGIVGVIASLAGLANFIKDGSQAGLILFLVVVPIVYPIMRAIFRRVSDSEAGKLQRTVDELARLTEGAGD